MKKTLLFAAIFLYVKADEICIGYLSNNSTDKVDTIIENNVTVTSSVELVETEHTGSFCSINGKQPISLGDCSFAGWILENPMCDDLISKTSWSYIEEKPNPANGICYPGTLENEEELRLKFSGILEFSKFEAFTSNGWGAVNSGAGVTAACKFWSSNSFFRNMVWLIHQSGTYPVIKRTFNNTKGRDVLIVWGIHHPATLKEHQDLYKKDSSYVAVGSETYNRRFIPEISTRPKVNGQAGRMTFYWTIVKPGESITFESNGAFLAPRYAFEIVSVGNGKLFRSELNIESCSTKCQTEIGGINTNKSFHSVHRNTIGDCPKYVNVKSLKLATGLRNVPAIASRGLFGAIAGFIEGGWPGLINGWYGFQHRNEEGTGIAADKESTQKAIDQITSKVNNIVDRMNTNFESVQHVFSEIEERINQLSKHVDDSVVDIWSYNAQLLVLLENEKTLDLHDSNVRNLHEKVRRMLKDNAKDEGNGCFTFHHKCDNECIERVRNGTYDHKEFEEESKINRQEIEGVKLDSSGNVYKILSIYSCIASSLVLAALIMGFILWACSNGSCRCTICI
ncbi:hemagglutinin [Influenza A virus (A/Oriental white stork/Zhalong/183/2006(H11N9))]|uniref:Hemagglutinin n=1 Tax=Influenza A virus (A/Oriental white stork/Zhalong/183/2006(H11N9)) TaxID=2050412 RepID=A0A3Q8C2S4_9INFA|nr:hemagglutinin [Influenza A virus (A/Oriental white stork/Zhalong/183/2006(H11N9))]